MRRATLYLPKSRSAFFRFLVLCFAPDSRHTVLCTRTSGREIIPPAFTPPPTSDEVNVATIFVCLLVLFILKSCLPMACPRTLGGEAAPLARMLIGCLVPAVFQEFRERLGCYWFTSTTPAYRVRYWQNKHSQRWGFQASTDGISFLGKCRNVCSALAKKNCSSATPHSRSR